MVLEVLALLARQFFNVEVACGDTHLVAALEILGLVDGTVADHFGVRIKLDRGRLVELRSLLVEESLVARARLVVLLEAFFALEGVLLVLLAGNLITKIIKINYKIWPVYHSRWYTRSSTYLFLDRFV